MHNFYPEGALDIYALVIVLVQHLYDFILCS